MKAIITMTLTAMLMASVMADELDDVSGGVYDSGSAVFSGGKGLAITQHGLLVEDGILTLTPKGIIDKFDLFRPIYSSTTNYGHFGKDNLPWEQVDLF
jgi:hypothetical protein